MTAKQQRIIVAEAIARLNQATTRARWAALINELPRECLGAVKGHFAAYGNSFPVGQAIVELIEARG